MKPFQCRLLLALLVLLNCRAQPSNDNSPLPAAPVKGSESTSVRPALVTLPAVNGEKAHISFRIGVPQWLSENRYRELLGWFEKYKGVTDEITFFTSATHPPLPLEEIARRAQILRERVVQAKALGYHAGINVLATIGHHNENLSNSLRAPFPHVTDPDGRICEGSFCPNAPEFQQYVRDLYRHIAEANPDYVWIDDDVRLAGHMPVHWTCFCTTCLALFKQETGTRFTRAELKTALFEGPLENRLPLRKQWLAHNRNTIAHLLATIEQTVHQVRPGLPLGFMSGERFYEGYDFDHWARILAGDDHAPVYWRPGGGFYEDSAMIGLLGKSHEIGRQVSLLPPEIRTIESEIENFPYQLLKKSARTTVLEAACHMAAGCTGAAFNVISGNDEPLHEFEPMLAAIRQARPFFDLLAEHFQRSPPLGLWSAWDKDSWAADLSFLSQSASLMEIGLPPAYNSSAGLVTLLSSASVMTMSDSQIKETLAHSVYMDPDALQSLNQRGYSPYTGVEVQNVLPIDCIEEFTSHALNHPFEGRQRDARQSFNHVPAYALRLAHPAAQALARLVDYSGREQATCSLAVFENSLGGRIAVESYFPWSFQHSLSKSAQLKSLMRWLSKDRLPAYVASYHKANVWAHQTKQGEPVMAILNASLDPAVALDLAILTKSKTVQIFDLTGQSESLKAAPADGAYQHFLLPRMDPWSAKLVVSTNNSLHAEP